ncbi:hypothetical protein [uncultured Croceitalea sp.]|uniref:hypothetical protein n=1 Tax=uncultured Croceitalea sp. TaxID=1798908 RepID=UPI0033065C52
MKKRLIFGLIISIIVIIGVIYFLGFGLGFNTRHARTEIPVTYKVGWWSNQKALTVTNLKVTIVESKLSMFNNHSIISYEIKGKLSLPRGTWQPYIEEVHICERNIQLSSEGHIATNKSIANTKETWDESNPQVIIEITPIVDTKKSNSYNAGDVIDFSFKNEHKIQSLWWGKNYYKIKCGDFEKVIVLDQNK